MTIGPEGAPIVPDPGWRDESNPCARLCRVLGLDPELVEGFTLSAFGGKPPTLSVHYIPDKLAGPNVPWWPTSRRGRRD